MPEYLTSILQILDYGLKTNSYKFALLRAMADYGEQGPADDLITRRWLAQRFVEYYWPLTLTFRVRQATDPTRDPVIMRFIRQEATELSLSPSCQVHKYRREYTKRYEALLKWCCDPGGCFDEVIPRFHNVHRGHVRAPLYDAGENGLRLKCQKCNSAKGDRMPQELYLSKLRERNAGLLNSLHSGALAPAQREVRRDIQEFASRDLDAHIRTLVDACREDGFGVWDPTSKGATAQSAAV